MESNNILKKASKARLDHVDIMRGLGIILVIFGHSLQIFFENDYHSSLVAYETWKVIYSFHMPLFFFISGLTVRKIDDSSSREASERFFYLLALAYVSQFFLGLVIFAARILSGRDIYAVLGEIFFPIITGGDFKMIVTWFLVSLAIMRFLWRIVSPSLIWRLPFVAILLFLLYSISYFYQFRFFQIHNLFFGGLYFILGIFTSGTLAKYFRFFSLTSASGISMLLSGLLISLVPLNRGCFFDVNTACRGGHTVDMNSGLYGFFPLFISTAFIGIALIYFLSIMLSYSPLSHQLVRIGRKTLPLLFLNGFVLIALQTRIAAMMADDQVTFALLLFVGVVMVLAHVAILPVIDVLFRYFDRACSRIAQRLASLFFGEKMA